MGFRDPWLLLLAILAPLVFVAASRVGSAVSFSSLSLLDRGGRTWRVRLAKAPALLMSLTVVFLAVASAGPRTPDAETRIHREGIGIMAVVDRSGSMHARDLVRDDTSVDRLAVVKDVFREFVGGGRSTRGRPDDQIGLIAFAGYADSLCPLTNDHGNLLTMVDDLEIVRQRDEDGTALGDALALAVERLRRTQAKSKVVILLTDGVNNAGEVAPDQAAALAQQHEIKVYCIGAGTEGVAPFPTIDPFSGRTRLQPIRVEIDEKTLRNVAETTGGRYFRATDKDQLADIYAEIDKLEKTKTDEIRYLQYTEHYGWFVLAALGLAGLAAIFNGTLFRTLP